MSGYKSKASDIMHWFGLVMIFTYFVLGAYVLFTDNLKYLGENVRFVFGFFFFAFGFFRAVNWWQKHKARKYVDDSDYSEV